MRGPTMTVLKVWLLAMGVAAGCDPGESAERTELDDPEPRSAAASERPPEAPAPAAPAEADEPTLDHAAIRARVAEKREIADAYAAGTLGDRLPERGLLLVDPTPAEGSAVHFFLYAGAIEPGEDFAALKAAAGSDGRGPRTILLGGDDRMRPAIFDAVDPGTYTACALVAGPGDQEATRVIEEVAAEVEARAGEKPLAEQIQEASAEVERRLGRPVEKLGFDGITPRCARVVAGDDTPSRIVTLGA